MQGLTRKDAAMNDKPGNGAGGSRDIKLTCPCCGARVGLRADNGARLELEEAGHAPTFAPGTMFIDTHAHMISRTTDDYQAMARARVVAVIEPAFWLGQPRTNLGSYVDYLSTIIGFERFRAGQFGVRHYCCVGLNPKEANNQALADAVLEVLPHFAAKEGVDSAPDGYLPWFEVPGRASAGTPIVFGHWAALGLIDRPDLLAIDTGCVWGRQLTAVRLSDRAKRSVACA